MLPIKFKEFAKNPIVGTLFIVMGAIGALYVDIRSTFQDQAKSQDVRIEKLEKRVDVVSDAAVYTGDNSVSVKEVLDAINSNLANSLILETTNQRT